MFEGRPDVFAKRRSVKIEFLKNFAKFTGKHYLWSVEVSFLIKFQFSDLKLYLKQRLKFKCLPVNFAEIFKNIFFHRTPPIAASGWLQAPKWTLKIKWLQMPVNRLDNTNTRK